MKKVILFISIIFLSISFLSAQFEGKVTMETSENAETITFLLKGDQVKIVPDLEEQKAEMFMNGETGDMTFIMGDGEERFGMKMNLNNNSLFANQMKAAMAQTNADDKVEEVDIKWTGEMKTVNGQRCEKVTGTSSDGNFTAWVAKDLGLEFSDLFPINNPMTNELKDKLFGAGMKGFPMQVTTTDKNGEELVMNTTVDEMSVSDKDMTPAANIEVLDMDNFLQEIMAAQNDPDKMKEIEKKMQRFQKMMEK